MVTDEMVGKAAVAMCLKGGFDPYEAMPNDGPRWKYYVDGARAALEAALSAAEPAVSEVTHEDICNTHEGGTCNCDWSAADERHPHPDELAVDRFAAAMKAKLAKKRDEGRGGWEDKDDCSQLYLSQLLREHVEKGDPVDVGNLAMMLHQRQDRISSLLETLQGE